MSPVYDFSTHDDRVRYALDRLSRQQRQEWVREVRRRYGEAAAQAVLEALHAKAKERVA